ncbi:glycosyltransferase family 2 protein [Priestia megaterium]|uniref:glycosyltransferase family 2 protein n=1 Tax=Priestia megaterium TaxID=1404 RepID=UPI0013E28B76|nr:glycosyltransferase [Priestia megaterium]MED3866650.1 glycosyltransferase [Priestia megaterium]MED4098106.1 glycosyltransferase [Priestia megaterium]MED4141607.1 glycosyltransferase [Priestia megaterium]MED4165322.1 glycosyltransferase [Priestia megaterium]MED4200811.1 glycosyltransferase [Priestia megaterium]
MSKISVIVPIYNAGNKLNKCIKSILNQTFKDFELILVNDGSTDNSLLICDKYKKTDERIIVIDKKNEGSIEARKRGIEVSNSSYIMFVDADDWVDKRMIETLYSESMDSCIDITVCNMYKAFGNLLVVKKKNNSKYFNKVKIYEKEEIKKELIVAYFHGHPFPSSLCAKLYKKELLQSSGNYLERITFLGEDLFYNLEMFMKANRVKVIDKSLYYYRVGGFTSKYMPHLFNDMVNGYRIQKEVIDEYYLDTQQKEYDGISIMLLNTFKTCLYNLFNSKFDKSEIENLIERYTSNEELIECLYNEGSIKYFPVEYLNAIRNKDIDHLYELGKAMYKKKRPKMALMNIVSKVSLI